MVHDGEMRRSDEELGELTRRGTSATLWRDILASERLRYGGLGTTLRGASVDRASLGKTTVFQNAGVVLVAWCALAEIAGTTNPRSPTTPGRVLPGDA
jgi:hypothetical protein